MAFDAAADATDAMHEVGKARVCKRELRRTVPHVNIEVVETALDADNAEELLRGCDVAVLAYPSAPQHPPLPSLQPPAEACPLAAGVAACQRLGVGCLPVLYADAAVPFPERVGLVCVRGAEVTHVADEEGNTALLFSCEGGRTACVKLLLDRSADPNVRNTATGRTPLHVACFGGHCGCVVLLLASSRLGL